MQERSATLKEVSDPAQRQTEVSISVQPAQRTMRFTYPSGSQPLEGYTIKRGIGIGGFGEVYFAISDAGKEVAIKRIQRNLDIELRGVRQCLNLKHVNLISLWDIRSNDLGESWVVMEYVPGYCLRRKLQEFPQGMPAPLLRSWFQSILAGVGYLHRHGIVHRDLKPGNIFYDTDQQIVKIGDYGLSKFISCSRRSGQTESVGTFHYMAPEIGKGVYGKEIDVYALGVILFEMLTGDLPFDGESAQEIIMKHLTANPDLSKVPVEYRDCIEGSLRKDPEQRLSSVQEMWALLPWGGEMAAVGPSMDWTESPSESPESLKQSQTSRGPRTRVDEPPSRAGATSQETPAHNRPHDESEILYIDDDVVEVIRATDPFDRMQSRIRNGLNAAAPFVPVAASQAGRLPAEIASVPRRSAAPAEPIAEAVKGGLGGLANWWNRSELSVPVKVTLTVIATIVLIINSSWLLLVAMLLGSAYLIYLTVRSWFMPADHEVQYRESKSVYLQQQKRLLRQELVARSLSERLSELTGSMLVAAASCIVFSLIGLAIRGTILKPDFHSWSLYAWLAITSVVTSWTILAINKTWEHREGDTWLRRLTFMVAGLAIGGISFGLGNAFYVTDFAGVDVAANRAVPQFVGWPVLTSFLVFFTGWLGVTRLWRLADPIRRSRLRLLPVGLNLALAVGLGHVVNINPVLFGMVAVITTLATQLAAPLLDPVDNHSVAFSRR